MENVKRLPAKLVLVDKTPIAFESDPNRGFIQIKSSQTIITSGDFGSSVTADKRHCNITGDIDILKDLVEDFVENGIAGKIVITETLYSDLSPEFIAGIKDISRYLKIGGNSKIVLTLKGESIYRIAKHSYNLDAEDTYIAHDNGGEIREFAKAEKAAKAKAEMDAAKL
jgi:hypothetical protein